MTKAQNEYISHRWTFFWVVQTQVFRSKEEICILKIALPRGGRQRVGSQEISSPWTDRWNPGKTRANKLLNIHNQWVSVSTWYFKSKHFQTLVKTDALIAAKILRQSMKHSWKQTQRSRWATAGSRPKLSLGSASAALLYRGPRMGPHRCPVGWSGLECVRSHRQTHHCIWGMEKSLHC